MTSQVGVVAKQALEAEMRWSSGSPSRVFSPDAADITPHTQRLLRKESLPIRGSGCRVTDGGSVEVPGGKTLDIPFPELKCYYSVPGCTLHLLRV